VVWLAHARRRAARAKKKRIFSRREVDVWKYVTPFFDGTLGRETVVILLSPLAQLDCKSNCQLGEL
jgi:hypothetical protein